MAQKTKKEQVRKTVGKKVKKVLEDAEKVFVTNVVQQKVELIMYDEYNQSSILGNSKNVKDLFSQAEKFVTSANVENALAASEKDKAWEAFFPVFVDKKGQVDFSRLYAGNKKNGKHYYYEYVDGKYVLLELDASNKNRDNLKFLLGLLDTPKGKEQWFLKTPKGQEVKLDDELLQQKSVLFFKVL